ncbi:MAG: TRAP transporter small permease subunit [Polyangiaceae bacterium]|nr:TRAP transporter small permease subunit [Polyangiaceae bacterium]
MTDTQDRPPAGGADPVTPTSNPPPAAAAAADVAAPEDGHAPALLPRRRWAEPLSRVDAAWTRVEVRLITAVVLAQLVALAAWVGLKGLATGLPTPEGGSRAGIVFRALFGACVLGGLTWWALRKQDEKRRSIGTTVAVLAAFGLSRAWGNLLVDWSSNLLNWYQQASTLTLLGGLRGVGTRLTMLMTLLGGSLATAAGKHITIDLVTRFVRPRVRLPMILIGWVGSAFFCFVASWGFFDHIAIGDFGANKDMTVGQKFEKVGDGLGEDWFIFRKQLALDMKTLPHVASGEGYAGWLKGAEWNPWLREAGFVDRFGAEAVKALELPETSARSPIVSIPGKGEPRGELSHAANLMFPFGLLVIGFRFLLLVALTLGGHRDIDADQELEIGARVPPPEPDPEPEPAPSGDASEGESAAASAREVSAERAGADADHEKEDVR